MKCSTCGIRLESEQNWVKFPCPGCGKETIFRCDRCKKLENTYICSKCKFEGP
ncbi:MAG: DUF1610 domain-containing protein [Candidatus Aenigmarchaeota archaeon]|nr:DUF1610 domain-containing protein [Candidatus Aenigmarchaeota archaeon]